MKTTHNRLATVATVAQGLAGRLRIAIRGDSIPIAEEAAIVAESLDGMAAWCLEEIAAEQAHLAEHAVNGAALADGQAASHSRETADASVLLASPQIAAPDPEC